MQNCYYFGINTLCILKTNLKLCDICNCCDISQCGAYLLITLLPFCTSTSANVYKTMVLISHKTKLRTEKNINTELSFMKIYVCSAFCNSHSTIFLMRCHFR